MKSLYPWQFSIWQEIWHAGDERIPHAILLHGNPGLGKLAFAETLVKSLLCRARRVDHLACEHCASCRYVEQNAHPDFRHVVPEADQEAYDAAVPESGGAKDKKGSEFITVNQIRALADFVSLTSHQNGRRVILVAPAEQLNLNAANGLLKMLEEPPGQTIFLLVTNQLSRILPTVRSRCRLMRMPMPDSVEASAWLAEQGCAKPELNLALAGQAPLEALRNATDAEWHDQRETFCDALSHPDCADVIGIAEVLQKSPAPQVMRWLQTWVYDLMSLNMTSQCRYHPDYLKAITNLNKNIQLTDLLNFNRELSDARRLVHHPLNPKLFWESILIKYFALFS